MNEEKKEETSEMIEMPAPTVWPMVTAFGLALLFAGLVTSLAVSVVGLILTARGAVGWFRDVLPVEKHELIPARPIEQRAQPVKVSPRSVTLLRAGEAGHRVHIPSRIHPYTSGIKGGIAGGIAMAFVACAYGAIAYGSVWYPINLLDAAVLPSMATADLPRLKAFDLPAVALAIPFTARSRYSSDCSSRCCCRCCRRAVTPSWEVYSRRCFGRRWSGATLGLVNPALNARIDWVWFIASQVAFGLVAGYIVHHTETVETMQSWPLAARAGLRAPGVLRERSPRERGEERQ